MNNARPVGNHARSPANRLLGKSPHPDRTSAPAKATPKRLDVGDFVPAALMALVVLAYLPILLSPAYFYDDYTHLKASPTSQGLDGLWRIWSDPSTMPQYYPLTHTLWWLAYRLWGFDPWWMHALNIGLHGGVAIALWRVLLALGFTSGLAFVSAALFAVHPVQVESAGYVSELKNVLSGLLCCAATLAYFRFEPPCGLPNARRRAWRWYAWAAILFCGALLSKTVAATLPPALVLVFWWKQGRLRWRQIWPLAILTTIGALMGWVTARIETTQVGVALYPEDFGFSLAQRCLIAGRALWFYAQKAVWPHPLMLIYPRWHVDPREGWQWLYPAAALVVLVSLWLLRRRAGRGPLVAVLIFAGVLFPALGFVDVYPFRYSFVADHYQYLAIAALLSLLAACGHRLMQSSSPMIRGAASAFLILALVAATMAHARTFSSALSAWQTCVQRNPNSWTARNNLAAILISLGRFEEARRHLDEALRLKPDAEVSHCARAALLASEGHPDQAVTYLETTIAAGHRHPRIYVDCATRLLQMNQPSRAKPYGQRAVELDPGYADARVALGLALLAEGQYAEAVQLVRASPRLRNSSPRLHEVLGRAYLGLSQNPQALTAFRHAVALAPTEMHFRLVLAAALARTGDHPQAVRELQQAIRLIRELEPYDPPTARRWDHERRDLLVSLDAGQMPPLPPALPANRPPHATDDQKTDATQPDQATLFHAFPPLHSRTAMP